VIRETLGTVIGKVVAPGFALAAGLRQSRFLHPEGIVFAATVESMADPATDVVARRLRGPALLRLSAAMWKNEKEWPDVLGCAIRFRSRSVVSTTPDDGDQDLLFATIRSPLTMPFAPLATNAHDFLENTYFATSPFDVEGIGRVKWRLVPEQTELHAFGSRRRRILQAVASHRGSFRLELRSTFRLAWRAVVRITPTELLSIDQDALRFWPFRNGRGITPRGFVHALRRGAYAGSQAAGHP
jgi:hypothetical protein